MLIDKELFQQKFSKNFTTSSNRHPAEIRQQTIFTRNSPEKSTRKKGAKKSPSKTTRVKIRVKISTQSETR